MKILGNPWMGQNRSRKAAAETPHRRKRPPEQRAAAQTALRSTRCSGLGLQAPLTGLQWAPKPSPYCILTLPPQGNPNRQSSPMYGELRSRHCLQRARVRTARTRTASWRACPAPRLRPHPGPLSGADCKPHLGAWADSSPGELSP